MFDRLVESTKSKQRSRSGRFLFLTGLIYAMLLTVLAVWTIMGFSPGLAESIDWARLTPPVPYTPPPVIQRTLQVSNRALSFRQPTGEAAIPKPETVLPLQPHNDRRLVVTSGIPGSDGDRFGSVNFTPGGSETGVPVPPPPVKPKPTPEPTPEVKPTPQAPLKVSIGVTQGLAIRKVTPQYPVIARSAHVTGPVQVQVLISEEGRVIDAEVLSGNPLLRQAALAAARQWVFRPTLLSNVPVKVQGLLTFNFTFN